MVYLRHNILCRGYGRFLKRILIDSILMLFITIFGLYVVDTIRIENYFMWILVASIVFFIAVILTVLFHKVFYKDSLTVVKNMVLRKYKKE